MATASRNPRRPLPEVRNQLRPQTDWLGYICDMSTYPYNPNHVMKSHRLMRHVTKCEQRHLGTTDDVDKRGVIITDEYEKCPYNSLHRYSPEKEAEHFKECKDRAMEIIARVKAGENVDHIDNRYSSKKSAKELKDSNSNPKSDTDLPSVIDHLSSIKAAVVDC